MDELGVLVAGHPRNAYWYGSQLSIQEARQLAPHNSATSLQVTVSALAGMIWAMENPNSGVVEPDDLAHHVDPHDPSRAQEHERESQAATRPRARVAREGRARGCAGGTGPALRDVTPEATLAVAHKQMPGFGEQMRAISLNFVPTAILSRQVAVIRDQTLIINLPGQPKAIAETLEGVKDAEGKQVVPGIFAAVPYCVDLIGGPYIDTVDTVCKAFRPKSAIRPTQD